MKNVQLELILEKIGRTIYLGTYIYIFIFVLSKDVFRQGDFAYHYLFIQALLSSHTYRTYPAFNSYL